MTKSKLWHIFSCAKLDKQNIKDKSNKIAIETEQRYNIYAWNQIMSDSNLRDLKFHEAFIREWSGFLKSD